MKFDYKNGKVFVEETADIKFFKENKMVLVMGSPNAEIERVFRQEVVDVGTLFEMWFKKTVNFRRFKYLLVDITLTSNKYMEMLYKIITMFEFRNVVLISHVPLGELDAGKYVRYLKESFVFKVK